MSKTKIVVACIVVLLCVGFLRAQRFKFQERINQIRQEAIASAKAQGLAGAALKAKYPTPYINGVSGTCIPPGGTGEIAVQGKFGPGTRFVLQNDNFEIVKEALTPAEYRATVRVAPGTGPQTAGIMAIAGSGVTASMPDGAKVGGRYQWEVTAPNGWKVVARSAQGNACTVGGGSSSQPYKVDFYRPGEAQPFETREANLNFSMYDRAGYQFSLREPGPAGAAELQEIGKRLVDPNLTDAQREQLMQRMEKAQEQMIANMKKVMDPAYIKAQEAKRQEFGCHNLVLSLNGAAVSGDLNCSTKVGRLPVSGSMKFVGM